MIFGTYKNPKKSDIACGFKPERESQMMEMLQFKNVNDSYKRK